MNGITPTERHALEYLRDYGPDVMPRVLESEEQIAAILCFAELKRRGLAVNSVGDDTITWTLTPTGAEVLALGTLQ